MYNSIYKKEYKMTFRCIKLDASWKPVDIVEWFDAFCQVYLEPYSCNLLYSYPEKYKIRSEHCSWNYPSIIVLKKYVKPKKEKLDIKPSLKAILTRDLYKCAYCGVTLSNKNGTRDHIIPESKGGPSSWTNLVACCKACQGKKKDYLPNDIGMHPNVIPKAPLLAERFNKYIKLSSSFERNVWKTGLKDLGLTQFLI